MLGEHAIVFSTPAYEYLQSELCRAVPAPRLEKGAVERKQFPDGERYQRLLTDVEDRDAVLIGGTISDIDTLTIYDLGCAVVEAGARTLTLVIPYFGYSTMERAVKPGEVVTAKTRARLLSAISPAGSGDRAILLDLHSEGIPYYFEGPMRATHLYAKPLIIEAAKRLGGPRNHEFVLACTDAGRAKWVQSLANEIGVPAAFVFKHRISGGETEVSALSAQVQGRLVVIYDDMIRTGSSLIHAAEAYRSAGATEIAAIATHGVFPDDAVERLRSSGLFTRIVCTNSHPRALEVRSEFIEVVSIAGLLKALLSGREQPVCSTTAVDDVEVRRRATAVDNPAQ